eukprot:jgi/Botrbrau1/10015/Bobra.0012s0102.1
MHGRDVQIGRERKEGCIHTRTGRKTSTPRCSRTCVSRRTPTSACESETVHEFGVPHVPAGRGHRQGRCELDRRRAVPRNPPVRVPLPPLCAQVPVGRQQTSSSRYSWTTMWGARSCASWAARDTARSCRCTYPRRRSAGPPSGRRWSKTTSACPAPRLGPRPNHHPQPTTSTITRTVRNRKGRQGRQQSTRRCLFWLGPCRSTPSLSPSRGVQGSSHWTSLLPAIAQLRQCPSPQAASVVAIPTGRGKMPSNLTARAGIEPATCHTPPLVMPQTIGVSALQKRVRSLMNSLRNSEATLGEGTKKALRAQLGRTTAEATGLQARQWMPKILPYTTAEMGPRRTGSSRTTRCRRPCCK